MPVLCLAGVVLNIAVNRFFVYYLGLPLFMDTIFTVAVTLVGGVFWGALCGALSTIIGKTIWFSDFISYLFFLCSIATASMNKGDCPDSAVLCTLHDHKRFGRPYFHPHSAAKPLASGERVLAGLVSDTMSGGAVPVVLAEILSRIPVNIIDCLIAALGGYGAAVVFRRTVR